MKLNYRDIVTSPDNPRT